MSVDGVTRARELTCPHCKAEVSPGSLLFKPFGTSCEACHSRLEITVFPELFNTSVTSRAGDIISAEEAACFYHEAKQASEVCDHCGRFLCALCSVDWHQEHLCPDCIQHAGQTRKRGNTSMGRTHYDRLTLALATLPALFIWPSMITAPAALFLVVYFWRRPCSFIEKRWHSRVRYIIAAMFALLQVAGWGFVIVQLATGGFS